MSLQRAAQVEAGKHFLVNLSPDPSLSELLVYYLKPMTRVGRAGEDGDVEIQLSGSGIQEHHCTLEINESSLVLTSIPGARTCVNGIEVDGETVLHNGDRLLWGSGHFFRVNCPTSSVNPNTGDNFDWTRHSGSTGSSGTGPSAAFDGTWYLYTETSPSSTWGATANLTIDCIDPASWTEASLVFAYHMYGSSMGTLNVDVSDDNGATWTNVWTLSGNQGNAWHEASVNLSSYTSQIDLRIQSVGGTSFTSDMAIDLTRLQENVGGCLDSNANNYDASALIDDGSCTYTMGCTNPYAETKLEIEKILKEIIQLET